MKKAFAVILSAVLLFSCAAFSVSAGEAAVNKGAPTGFDNIGALYAHAVLNSDDGEAWQAWQSVHDENFLYRDTGTKYFFLPVSSDESTVDIYNAFDFGVTVNGTVIPSHQTRAVTYSTGGSSSVTAGGRTYTLKFMKSNAEAAVYVNNPDADGNGTDLMSYLNADKSRSATATGAVVDPDGSIDNTPIKKIKGRGNTTWTNSEKKPYNITYTKKVSVGGMVKNKKYSLLANFQDDTLARNRVLYDLSDAVGIPYASDSRFVDFYVNGVYRGSYQMCEKVGADSLATDIDTESYLNSDGTLKEEFPFLCEVDWGAGEDDYYVTLKNGVNITIKDPEIEPGQPGYSEVLAFVKRKFEQFTDIAVNKNGRVSDVADLDSVTKLYLINELGKNWDSGAGSTFFTYKADENGDFKFFGSPVWDYDNSLGNAVGVDSENQWMGVTDYTKFSGWWCRFKGKHHSGSYAINNIINNLSWNNEVQQAAARIWFEDFMPAINHFAGKTDNPIVSDELYSAEKYVSLLRDSAEMNYTSGWWMREGGWIADHSSIKQATYDLNTDKYKVKNQALQFSSDFSGVFDFMKEWTVSRAAWLSSQMAQEYGKKQYRGDADFDGIVNINDVTAVQKYLAGMTGFTALQYELGNVRNADGLNISDATAIQRAIARIEPLPGIAEPEEAPDEYTVTFTNTLEWAGDIYCYAWYYDESEVRSVWLESWPGTKMTPIGKDGSGKNVYSFTFPSEMKYLVFGNGSGDMEDRTTDIIFDPGEPHFRATEKIGLRGCREYESFEEPPVIAAQPDPEPDSYTLTFTDNLDWGGDIYCNAWYYDESEAVAVRQASWPGIKMTLLGKNSDGDNVYSVAVSSEMRYIFFNNGDSQTKKRTADIVYNTAKLNYRAVNQIDARGWYGYESSKTTPVIVGG